MPESPASPNAEDSQLAYIVMVVLTTVLGLAAIVGLIAAARGRGRRTEVEAERRLHEAIDRPATPPPGPRGALPPGRPAGAAHFKSARLRCWRLLTPATLLRATFPVDGGQLCPRWSGPTLS